MLEHIISARILLLNVQLTVLYHWYCCWNTAWWSNISYMYVWKTNWLWGNKMHI